MDQSYIKSTNIKINNSNIYTIVVVGEATFANDIATIRLTTAATGTNISPITRGSTNAGASVTLIGWGRTSPSGPLADTLQQVNSFVIQNSACQNQIGNTIYDGHVCVYNAASGTCTVSVLIILV